MRITGRVEILLNGKLLLNKEGASITGIGLSGKPAFEREIITGPTGPHGSIEKPITPMLEVTVTDRDDIMLNDFALINGNGTAIFRTAGGGKTYIGEGATCLNNFGLTDGQGEVKLRFAVPYWIEKVEA
jgi:hypothetical protein